jgi:hypothetical protein|mmetsp:Transcript_44513/g.72423  ORF Transcript_44513/g.72423 Transcript_44513/m.72423 type:complete len:201 (+) Transcript_44513:1359-1961(+)
MAQRLGNLPISLTSSEHRPEVNTKKPTNIAQDVPSLSLGSVLGWICWFALHRGKYHRTTCTVHHHPFALGTGAALFSSDTLLRELYSSALLAARLCHATRPDTRKHKILYLALHSLHASGQPSILRFPKKTFRKLALVDFATWRRTRRASRSTGLCTSCGSWVYGTSFELLTYFNAATSPPSVWRFPKKTLQQWDGCTWG